jgi:predicted AAA+ superfamily ATPase
MTAFSYQARIADRELETRLRAAGAVVIEGPKACGKTATARQLAESEVLLDLDADARQAASIDPGLVLEGPAPRLLDEWQLAPGLWNAVRRAVDDSQSTGRFILTGSAVPADDETRHTGAGRIVRLRMRPMSLYELGISTGALSLRALLEGETPRSSDSGLGVPALAERLAVGGWPAFRTLRTEDALAGVRGYLDEITRADVNRVDGRRRDPLRVGLVLRSLARHIATHVSVSTIAEDVGGEDDLAIKRQTVADYLDALSRLMIVEDQPAWTPHLRSRARIRSAVKRHFVDPSLAVAALRATPDRLLRDLNQLGYLFESLVVRDLRIYAQPLDGTIYQYRDSNDLEADAVVELADGRWAAFEVKLGGSEAIDQAAASLLRFARGIDTSKSGEPALLGVITGGGYGYRRPDGVAVIPIGALGP